MKVKELIEELKKLDQDKEVYLSSDTEGNSYGTIEKGFIEGYGNCYAIYPYEEGIDFDELYERHSK